MKILPNEFKPAHDLCFLIHDIMVELLKSGDESQAFNQTFELTQNEVESLDKSEDHIIDWLNENEKYKESSLVIRSTVLPALLSDMLHCVYEAMKASEKGKLTISYMLIRKPIQESLFVLESMILDHEQFIKDFANDQKKLSPSSAGGIEGHTKRIANVLDKLKLNTVLSPEYIAQLRYSKASEDSFDGVCNKAMHLFTSHKSIKTESQNINFIFAKGEQFPSLWAYFYSRLPYLLYYIYQVVEYICAEIAPTSNNYLLHMQRWVSSKYIVAFPFIEDQYQCKHIDNLHLSFLIWLNNDCIKYGYEGLEKVDLVKLSLSGVYDDVGRV
ncbi:hypothetical protein [Aliivibrio fischeri]|uniref:hypothetical protein n=1 Tax=Aliivibrio fischeri TaxID=668 RepID=UPI0012DA06BE|nr:hypothetical protein [Aliivibrio fischeri]MUJ39714.1 hypothetical protein [Aliivibrio fischeri]